MRILVILAALVSVAFGHQIPSGSLDQEVSFVAVDATDFHTRETGLTSGWTVYYSINGGTPAAMTGPTVTQLDATNMPGVYALIIDEAPMVALTAGDDTHELALHITHASADPTTRVITIYRAKITEGQVVTAANNYIDADVMHMQGSATGALALDDFAINGYDSTNNGTNVYTVRGSAPKSDSDFQAATLLALEDIQLQYLIDAALPSQPTAGSYLYDLTEDNAGTQRFTAAALGEAPSGTGGDASAANQTSILAAIATAQTDLDNPTQYQAIITSLATAAELATHDGKLDTADAIIDASKVILDIIAGMYEDSTGYRWTEKALEQAPSGTVNGAADWTSGETNQIRKALGMTGTQAATTGDGVLDLTYRNTIGGN